MTPARADHLPAQLTAADDMGKQQFKYCNARFILLAVAVLGDLSFGALRSLSHSLVSIAALRCECQPLWEQHRKQDFSRCHLLENGPKTGVRRVTTACPTGSIPNLPPRPPKQDVACFTGGLIFGWNALTLMLKQQGNYLGGCDLPQNRALACRHCDAESRIQPTVSQAACSATGIRPSLVNCLSCYGVVAAQDKKSSSAIALRRGHTKRIDGMPL